MADEDFVDLATGKLDAMSVRSPSLIVIRFGHSNSLISAL